MTVSLMSWLRAIELSLALRSRMSDVVRDRLVHIVPVEATVAPTVSYGPKLVPCALL